MIVVRCHCGHVLWSGVLQKTRIGPRPTLRDVVLMHRGRCPRCGRQLTPTVKHYTVRVVRHA